MHVQWIINNLAILNEMISSVTVGLIDIFPKGLYQICRILSSVQFHALLHTVWRMWRRAQSQALISQLILLVAKCVPKLWFSHGYIYTAPHLVQLLSCRCGNSPFIMSCFGLNHLPNCSQAIVEAPMWWVTFVCCGPLVQTHTLQGPDTCAGSEYFYDTTISRADLNDPNIFRSLH